MSVAKGSTVIGRKLRWGRQMPAGEQVNILKFSLVPMWAWESGRNGAPDPGPVVGVPLTRR